jgi:FlaA1/EpsC-like NDP-sugar epimerase
MQIVTNLMGYIHKQLSVPLRNRFFLIGDLILIIISVLGSFALRLELGPLFIFYLPQAGWMILIALLVKPIVYRKFGLYRRLWSYASANEIKPIVAAVTSASVFVALGVLVLTIVQSSFTRVYHGFPRATLIIDWLLSLVLVGGFRYLPRLMADSRRTMANSTRKKAPEKPRRVLIVGAGDAGVLVVREMQKNPRLNMEPICFVDDDPSKQKQQIHDVAVLGTINDLPRVIDLKRIQEVAFAIPSAPGSVVRQVADHCRRKGIPFRTVPSIYELIGGQGSVKRLREVEITDLLRRAPISIDDYQVGLNLSGKRVLVTGAGGSIGRELCRQIAHWRPSSLILLGHGENSIFKILPGCLSCCRP